MKDNRRDKGSISLLFLAVLLPFMVTLSALSIDLSRWNSRKSSLQLYADKIAISATHALPNIELAQQVISSSEYSLPEGFFIASTKIENNSVYLEIQGNEKLVFDTFMPVTERERSYGIQVTSEVQLLPSDNIVIFSNGSSLRPLISRDLIEADSYEAWGNNYNWPESDYFLRISKPLLTDSNTDKELSWDVEYKRLLTQSCYNPSFSIVKNTTNSIVTHLLASKTNRVGVIATPGVREQGVPKAVRFSVYRNLLGEYIDDTGAVVNRSQVGGFAFAEQQQTAIYKPHHEYDNGLGTEACIHFSVLDTSGRYKNPFGSSLSESELYKLPPHGPFNSYNWVDRSFVEKNIKIQDAIHWTPAIAVRNNSDIERQLSSPDLLSAITQSHIEFAMAGSIQAGHLNNKVRGNVYSRAKKRVIVVTDTLPDLDEVKGILSAKIADQVEHVFLVFNHKYLSDKARKDLDNKINSYQEFIDNIEINQNQNHKISLHHTSNAEHFSSTILEHVLHATRTVVIRR